MPERQFMLLSKIRTDGGTQARAAIRPEVVDEYAEAVKGGAEMPPADVFEDEAGNVWMGDGHYRHAAYGRAGKNAMPINVRKGSLRDAQLYAAGANDSHGQPRSAEDKRAAVEMLLKDEEWGKASDRWIAERCRVSGHTVADVRKSLNGDGKCHDSTTTAQTRGDDTIVPPTRPQRRKGKDGRMVPAKPSPILCARCQTVAPGVGVPDCPMCKEARAGRDKKRRGGGGAKKNGAVLWDWKPFEKNFGALVREIDRLAGAYKAKEAKEADALRARLKDFKAAMVAWHKELAGAGK